MASTTGIMLDPVYTVKAVKGMLEEMTHRPERFKGRRVLFVHTGTLEAGSTCWAVSGCVGGARLTSGPMVQGDPF